MNRRVAREEQQARNRADENWAVRVPVAAGRREVTVAFLDKAASVPTGKREPFLRPFPRGLNIPEGRYGSYLRYVEIGGPYDATGPGQTASRERIFVCRPAAEQATAYGGGRGLRENHPREPRASRVSTARRRCRRRAASSISIAPGTARPAASTAASRSL